MTLWIFKNFCHLKWCIVVSHHGFLHFPNTQYCRTPFHASISNSYTFFVELPNLLPIWDKRRSSYYIVVSILYIFRIQVLYQMSDLQTFSPSLWLLFLIFLMVSFEEQRFSIWMKFSSFFSVGIHAFAVISKKYLSKPKS